MRGKSPCFSNDAVPYEPCLLGARTALSARTRLSALRFMGSPLSFFRMHWAHEPDRHPFPCPLPAGRGEGGRRPGEGWFRERIDGTTRSLVTVLQNPLLAPRLWPLDS